MVFQPSIALKLASSTNYHEKQNSTQIIPHENIGIGSSKNINVLFFQMHVFALDVLLKHDAMFLGGMNYNVWDHLSTSLLIINKTLLAKGT